MTCGAHGEDGLPGMRELGRQAHCENVMRVLAAGDGSHVSLSQTTTRDPGDPGEPYRRLFTVRPRRSYALQGEVFSPVAERAPQANLLKCALKDVLGIL